MSSLASPLIQHNSCNWGTFSSRYLINLIEIFCDAPGVCLCHFHCRPANMNTPLHPSQLFRLPWILEGAQSGTFQWCPRSFTSPIPYSQQSRGWEEKWNEAASSMQTHFIVAQEAEKPLFMGIWASFKDFYFKWEANMELFPATYPAPQMSSSKVSGGCICQV